MTQPYVYVIGWSKHEKFYIGRRTAVNCHPGELINSYFTSSDYARAFIYVYGEPDIVRTFPQPSIFQAAALEERLIDLTSAVTSSRYLNRSNRGERFHFSGKKHSKSSKQKMSKAAEGRIPWNKGLVGQQVAWNRGITGLNSGAANPFHGRRHTEQTKAVISQKMSGENHPKFGTKHSPETREKLRRKAKEREARKRIEKENLFGQQPPASSNQTQDDADANN